MAGKILIVEDELSIAELERDYLELSGYTVVIETNGRQALDKVFMESFDVYIIDIMLPDMDGIELCRNIRREIDKPIIMVSAKNGESDKIRCFNVGADDYMTKPFSPSELVARVKVRIERYNALTKKETVDYDVLEFNNVRVKLDSKMVYVDDKEVNLTSREYKLLVFLMENQGVIFSKEELFKTLWEGDAEEDSTITVPVHIKKLREKIERNPSRPTIIDTVWGEGYRIGGV